MHIFDVKCKITKKYYYKKHGPSILCVDILETPTFDQKVALVKKKASAENQVKMLLRLDWEQM